MKWNGIKWEYVISLLHFLYSYCQSVFHFIYYAKWQFRGIFLKATCRLLLDGRGCSPDQTLFTELFFWFQLVIKYSIRTLAALLKNTDYLRIIYSVSWVILWFCLDKHRWNLCISESPDFSWDGIHRCFTEGRTFWKTNPNHSWTSCGNWLGGQAEFLSTEIPWVCP